MSGLPWINRWLDVWWSWMVPMTWQLCLLVGAIIILTLLVRKASPRAHYLLWCLVLVKLCLPPTVSLYTGLGQLLPSPREETRTITGPTEVQKAQDTVARAMWPRPDIARQYQVLAVPEGPSLGKNVLILTGHIWLLGIVAMVSMLLYQCIRINMQVRRSRVTADKNLLKSFWNACKDCGVRRRIPLMISTELKSPVIFGLLRPKIILPQQTIDRLSQAELKAVFFHELFHLKRFDLWVNWLQAALLAVYWFHPLVWLAVSRLRSLQETIVDDLVLHHLKGEAAVYGSSLLNGNTLVL